MTECTITDAGGDTMTVLDFDGFKSSLFGRSPDYIRQVFRSLPHFKYRHDDIMLCSYPKAGCTWTFELLTMLLAGGPPAGGRTRGKMATMLEATAAGDIEALPSPRIMNSHMPFHRLPPDLSAKKIRTVFVVRNPKDVAVSMYNFVHGLEHYHYQGTWANWLQLYTQGTMTYGSYMDYLVEWQKVMATSDIPIHLLYYEDLKQDPLPEVKRLASFLGLSLGDDVLQTICDHCQFDVMKHSYNQELMSLYKHNTTDGFFRKGTVGNWKHWFTVAQNEAADQWIAEYEGLKFKFVYQL